MSAAWNANDLVPSASIALSLKPCIFHRALSGCYFINETDKRTIDTSDPQSSVSVAVNRVPLEICLYQFGCHSTAVVVAVVYLLLKTNKNKKTSEPGGIRSHEISVHNKGFEALPLTRGVSCVVR